MIDETPDEILPGLALGTSGALQGSTATLSSALRELLSEYDTLYGILCRDTTLTDIELMAEVGYQIVWFDLEHGTQSLERVLELARTVAHLHMVPMARIGELSRSSVQRLLDGGLQILCLPSVRSEDRARELVRFAKYPPLGSRGLATYVAATSFEKPADQNRAMLQANAATHLMVMIESETGFKNLQSILNVEGIDIVSVGKLDWAANEGLLGERTDEIETRAREVLELASAAGKLTAISASDSKQAATYRALGVRMLFLGGDIALKRQMLMDRLLEFQV